MVGWLEGILDAFEGLGLLGYALFVCAYVVAGVALVPEWIFTVAAGVLFGIAWGFVVAWGSAMAVAILAFLIARLALRKRIEKRVEKSKWLRAVNRALPKEGWKVVALARLSPLFPFGLQNYLFGLTKVHLRDYVVATALGIAPGTVVAVFLGATGRALIGGASPLRWTLFGLGLVATVVLSVYLARLAKRRLKIGET